MNTPMPTLRIMIMTLAPPSRLPLLAFIGVFLLFTSTVSLCSAHVVDNPLTEDVPYVEDVSERFTLSTTRIADWGQLPVSSGVTQVAFGVFNGNSGAWMLSDTSLFFATFQGSAYSSNHGAPTYTNVGPLLKLQPVPASRIAVNDVGNLVAVVTPTAVYHVSCVTTSSCSVSAKIGAAMSNVNDTAVSSDGDLWIACWSGLAFVPKPGSAYSTAAAAASAITWVVTSEPLYAVALRPDGKRVVTGGGNKFYIVDADPSSPTFAKVLRFEWVTIVYLGLGGVLDDTVTALEYDACGTLWIGNAVCLNVMYPNGTFARFDGLDGLPYGNITSIGRDYGSLPGIAAVGDMWVGTTAGLARYSAPGHPCIADAGSQVGEWKYMWGLRWLPGNGVTSVVSHENITFVGTDGGLARIERQSWTLERKADLFASIVPRHERTKYGFTADCSLRSIGNLTDMECNAGESDGLWTGIMALGEVLRYGVRKDQASAALAQKRMAAMEYLNTVTGIKGYMARTTTTIDQPHGGSNWYNSTADAGWVWMGDTSADEVCGHQFAFPAAYTVLGNVTGQESMLYNRINVMVGTIVENGYYLVGHDGKHTKWGIWAPSYVNDLRSWSDQRGLNSLQMIALLKQALKVTNRSLFSDALATLSNDTNQYQRNELNLKIIAPIDDNFSDDELAFLPFYSLLTADPTNKYTLAALTRSFNIVRHEKSCLWGAIYLATSGIADMSVVQDILWNLRTWPLEWINWQANNSQRIDVRINPEVNRDDQHNTMSTRILPANERSQFRWNANVFTLDDGSGMQEYDPGAWLSAYWVARYHGILGA